MSLVNISIVGNLAKAPEQTCFASGKVKTTLVVACNSPHRGSKSGERPSDKADFYKVEFWGKLAELTHKYLAKGNQVGVCGRLVFDHWQDKQGQERITPVVEGAQISFPPRLHVVKDNESELPADQQTNPLVGELAIGSALEDDPFGDSALVGNTAQSTEGEKRKTAIAK